MDPTSTTYLSVGVGGYGPKLDTGVSATHNVKATDKAQQKHEIYFLVRYVHSED